MVAACAPSWVLLLLTLLHPLLHHHLRIELHWRAGNFRFGVRDDLRQHGRAPVLNRLHHPHRTHLGAGPHVAFALVAGPVLARKSASRHRDRFRPDRVPLRHFLFHFVVVLSGGVHVHFHWLGLPGHHENHFVKLEVGGGHEHLAVSQIAAGVLAMSDFHPVALLRADHFFVHYIHFHLALL